MRAAVVGGAGFIGSHLVDALRARGEEVLVIDDLSTGRRENLEHGEGGGLELVELDITEQAPLAGALAGFRPERVFHLAAQADVRVAVARPDFDARVNVLGTINLLEAVCNAGPCPVILTSTGGAIYGEGEGRSLPFSERSETLPESGYGASKLAAETYLGLYRRLHGVPGLSLRLGNVYGPRQDPHGEAGVVAIFCGRHLEGSPLTVYGDGAQTRDYVYVDDVVEAVLSASGSFEAEPWPAVGPFNVGTGTEVSVLDLVAGLASASGREPRVEHAAPRTGEVQRVAIDPAAARAEFGWRAATGLDAGLERTWRWFEAA